MSAELIVRFRPRVAEAEARSTIRALGCTVRRRMRDDGDIVTLIVRGDKERIAGARRSLPTDPRVDHIEDNAGGYRVMGDDR